MLTQAQLDYRRGKFTGSLAPLVMTVADSARLNHIARVKAGLEPEEPPTYAMQLGSHVEPFIREQVVRRTGQAITRAGEIVDHPSEPDFCVTLDGYRAFDDCVCEFKFLSPWLKREDFFPYYYWQVLLQMVCTGAAHGVLITAQGTSEPVEHEVLFDQTCADALMDRGRAFMACVKAGTLPCPIPPPVPPDRMRAVDITKETTNWGPEMLAYLAMYSATKPYAEAYTAAGTAIRTLLPDDVNRVHAGRFTLARDKRGAIRITEKELAA